MTEPAHDAHEARAGVEPDQIDLTHYYLLLVITVAVVVAAAAAAVGITRLEGGDSARTFNVPASEALPEPHLQLEPERELKALRAQSEHRLTSYGYVDRAAGIVHIPIADAMRQLRARGLPTRSAAPTPEPP